MNRSPSDPVFETALNGLELLHRGKVRDVYALDAERMLIVTSDRLSAFDVVLPDPIPDKGRVLTEISNFWFARTRHIVQNHLTGLPVADFVKDSAERAMLEHRAIVVRRLRALPVEAVVRGYVIGSGWKEYQATGGICGIALPAGLRQADRLPEPIFTPATKAEEGHDENISFEQMAEIVGADLALKLRDLSLALYQRGAELAAKRGILLADTKFEFGLSDAGELILIDEALTPDSSRYWLADSWTPGKNPPSLDKQFLRDYLETLADWNKQAPAPHLPAAIVEGVRARYMDLADRFAITV